MHFLFGTVYRCGCNLLKIPKSNQINRLLSSAKPAVKSESGSEAVYHEKGKRPNVLEHPDYFEIGKLVSISDLFKARVHLGHRDGSLDERMKPYIFGSRLGHIIFDLDKTAALLRAALNVVAHIAYRDGIILFVGQSPQNGHIIEKTAKECSEFVHTREWRLGLFTNSTKMFGTLTRLPDLVIVLNTLTNVLDQHTAIVEAAKMAIPVVGIVDSNCNPNLITYPVPGNDDTPCSIELYCSLFKAAILKGKQKRLEHSKLEENSSVSN